MAKAKKKKTSMKAKPEAQDDVTTEALKTAIDEVNEQLDLDPDIEYSTDKEMRKELKDAMEDTDLFEGEEEFTSRTYKVFEALGIEHDAVKIKDESVSVKKGAEEEMTTKTKEKKMKTKVKTKRNEKKNVADTSKSNKAVVFKAWKNGKGIKDPEKLVKLVKDRVALNTVRGWLSAWNRGKNFPAAAKG